MSFAQLPDFAVQRHAVAIGLTTIAMGLHLDLQRAGLNDQAAAMMVAEALVEAAICMQRSAHVHAGRQPDLEPLRRFFDHVVDTPFRLVDRATLEPIIRN